MKVQCPQCSKIIELEHVDPGTKLLCVCGCSFAVKKEVTLEEYSSIDRRVPSYIGIYPVTDFIGFGGMGKIYKGIHPNLNIPVAIKAMRMEYVTDKSSCDRFIKSAKICARLNHPNIVRIYDCGYNEENIYLVMEYVGGKSSRELLESKGKLSCTEAAKIILDVCDGLIEAEHIGIVHRDIKPDNIVFAEDGTVKLLDLGLAKISGDMKMDKVHVTSRMTSLGTDQYMAPEQAMDALNCDSRADIYSLGVTLFHFVTGHLPFESENPVELRRMHATEPPPQPSQLEPSVDPKMERIILRCLEKRREDRYQLVEELADDLDAFLNNLILPSTLLKTRSVPEVKPSRKKKKPVLSGQIFPVLVLAIAFLCAFFLASGSFHFDIVNLLSDREFCVQELSSEAKKAMNVLSRQVWKQMDQYDFDRALELCLAYRGPYARETVSHRRMLAYQVQSQKKTALVNVMTLLVPLVKKGNFTGAFKYCSQSGAEKMFPALALVLQDLSMLPERFASQFSAGKKYPFSFEEQKACEMEILKVRGDKIRGKRPDGQIMEFSLEDLTLAEQEKFLQKESCEIRSLWMGAQCWKSGNREKASEFFRSSLFFGPFLTGEL